MEPPQVLLVGISGCSSSGKTTLAKLSAELLPTAVLIHEDDFFKHDEDIPFNGKYQIRDWDSPEALDMNLFGKELDHIKKTGNVSTELIHNNNHDNSEATEVRPEIQEEIKNKFAKVFNETSTKVVFVDGFMMFNDQHIASKFDLKLLIRAPYATLKKRRAARSGYQTLDSFWIDPPYYFDEFVYRSYARSHSHLFEGGNVEGVLKKDSKILDFVNDDTTDINDALMWVCDCVVAMAQKR
ncbi:LAQU0S05e02696g1_1 [Lachancea quebecensis]|uniref:LAQU0S05e02696g1_1 n=1 Tax=Lachancea quebecensis TaxID=1654605 RepID=A0A0N7MLH7_9SACH|nr:LAQU0S05e02696g1_1 [Lachancea quebecensis]